LFHALFHIGEAVVPTNPPLDPTGRGVRILLTGATSATLLDVMIAPGAYDASVKTGWKVNGPHTAWSYRGPGTATEILNLYAYRTSFSELNLGYGASLAVVLLAITLAVSLVMFRVRRAR